MALRHAKIKGLYELFSSIQAFFAVRLAQEVNGKRSVLKELAFFE